MKQAIEHFQTIEFSAKKVGLNINYDKTKIMIRIVDNPRTEVIEGKLVMKVAEITTLKVANDFKFLSTYIANCHVDSRQPRGLAWSQFWKLATVWKSKEISLSLKLHLFNSLILSIIFYNAETLPITKVTKKEIDSFGTNCYMYMLEIKRIDKVRNEEFLKRVRRNNLSNLLYKHQLRSLEH